MVVLCSPLVGANNGPYCVVTRALLIDLSGLGTECAHTHTHTLTLVMIINGAII